VRRLALVVCVLAAGCGGGEDRADLDGRLIEAAFANDIAEAGG